MLLELFHFFVSLIEVSAVVVSILLAGLLVAKVAFWALSRTLGIFSGRAVSPDLYDDETDDYDDSTIAPNQPDDTSAETQPSVAAGIDMDR